MVQSTEKTFSQTGILEEKTEIGFIERKMREPFSLPGPSRMLNLSLPTYTEKVFCAP